MRFTAPPLPTADEGRPASTTSKETSSEGSAEEALQQLLVAPQPETPTEEKLIHLGSAQVSQHRDGVLQTTAALCLGLYVPVSVRILYYLQYICRIVKVKRPDKL